MSSDTSISSERDILTRVDSIIDARWLLSAGLDDGPLEHHSLIIRDNCILDILPTTEAAGRYTADQHFHLDRHLVMPGLVNAHGHSPMSLMRGFADDMPLQPWLREKIWPAESRLICEEYVYDGTRLAIAEMLLSGITCFSDMYFFPDEIAKAAAQAGIRTQLAAPVFDFPTAWAKDAQEYIRKATQLHDEYRNHALISTAFGPHAPYTVSDDALREVATQANELEIPVHIHLHENAEEVNEALRDHGKRPLQRLLELELLSPYLQAVHMTQLEGDEIELLALNDVKVVHCPSSNLKLASGNCPLAMLEAAGITVALGTDGAASNNSLDILKEAHLAALQAKADAEDASAVPAASAFRMATINGARTLGLEENTGSLETGKAADITVLDLHTPNTQPVYNPYSTLVYSARAGQVSHVWVNGQQVVHEGSLLSMDMDELLQRAGHWADKMRN